MNALLPLFVLLLVSVAGAAHERDAGTAVADAAVVSRIAHPAPGQARLVALTPVGDRICHVSATAEDHFADRESLVVLP